MLTDFTKLILISCVIGAPLAWYFLNNWLQNFAYHIDLQWWCFGLVIMLLIAISWLTIGYQSIRVSLTNPAEVLKDE